MKLTIYHDKGFWVGVVEAYRDGKLLAFRYSFGAEPHHQEVLDFIRLHMPGLLEKLRDGVQSDPAPERRVSRKRLARLAAADTAAYGVSAPAQEALRLELEHRKKVRRTVTREQRDADRDRKREIARRKAKDKHRGR